MNQRDGAFLHVGDETRGIAEEAKDVKGLDG
jgi:hypothetical protein